MLHIRHAASMSDLFMLQRIEMSSSSPLPDLEPGRWRMLNYAWVSFFLTCGERGVYDDLAVDRCADLLSFNGRHGDGRVRGVLAAARAGKSARGTSGKSGCGRGGRSARGDWGRLRQPGPAQNLFTGLGINGKEAFMRKTNVVFCAAILGTSALACAQSTAPSGVAPDSAASPVDTSQSAPPPAQGGPKAAAPVQSSPRPGSGAGGPGPYTVVSWNEDWSYLRNPDHKTDFLDPIKYIPFNEDGDVYLSFGGQIRERFEDFNHALFGAGPQTRDGYYLQRYIAHADLHVGPDFRAYVEATSSFIDHRNGPTRPTDANRFDLMQGFVDMRLPFDDADSLTMRVGRQDLSYGAQRLISPLDWVNTRRTFDGGKLSFEMPHNTLDAFVVRPVIIDDIHPDQDDAHTTFSGIYDTWKLVDVLPRANTTFELYVLSLDKSSRAVEATSPAIKVGSDTYTLGTRLSATPRPWDFDVELDYQFGRSGTGTVNAWSVAMDGGYTFEQALFTPRVNLGFDAASGDRNPNNPDSQTFNQLFPLGHAYFGFIDVIGRQNIIDLHPGFELALARNKAYFQKLSFRTDYHMFWRENTNDAAYNAAGGVLRAAGTNRDQTIGSEVDLLLNWQIDRHLSAYAGYSHFFTGAFIDHTGANHDIDFIYTALQYDF